MIKFILSFIISCCPALTLLSQVSINNDGSPPHPSAGLEVNFSDKGVLIPRLDAAQILSIAAPAEGLILYNTTSHKPVYFNGSNWKHFDGSGIFEVGMQYGGGIIFYVDNSGDHGLIAAQADHGFAEWGCQGTSVSTGIAIGTGASNTAAIINDCSTSGIAARLCSDLVLNGYDDWFLPSLDEMALMSLHSNLIGGFVTWDYYWTSSASTDFSAYCFNVSGSAYVEPKDGAFFVRAIRAF